MFFASNSDRIANKETFREQKRPFLIEKLYLCNNLEIL